MARPHGFGKGMAMAQGRAKSHTYTEEDRARLCAIIAEKSLNRGAGDAFRLASGETSSFYFDMKPTLLDPEGANLVARGILERLARDEFDYLGGLAMGAIPIVAAVTALAWPERAIPGFFVRPEQKERGTKRRIEGNIEEGARVVLVEDVSTTGGSALQAAEAVWQFGCTVLKTVTVVDRLAGARENLAAKGIALEALFTRADFDL